MLNELTNIEQELQELDKLLEDTHKLLENTNKENSQLKEEVEKLKEQVKKKQQRFNDYGIKDYATISRFLEEIDEFNYKNRDKLFYILTLNNIITYEKICHFKSKIIDDEVGKLMSVKHNDNQRFIEMFEKGKLYELWSKFKHITIPNKEEWREIVKDKI